MSAFLFRATIPDTQKINTIGSCLGEHFLNPLVQQDSLVVVASYGPTGTGKSVLGRSMVTQLPPSYAELADKIKRPETDDDIIDTVTASGALRYRDFGPQTANPGLGSMMDDYLGMVPRKSLAGLDPNYRRGVDYLEHPPVPHLDEADLIVLIGKPVPDPDRGQQVFGYFDSIGRGVAGHDITVPVASQNFSYACSNPRTPQIVQEMRRLKQGIVSRNHQYGAEARHVVIILSNNRPEFRQAFNNFGGCPR